ncbi:MAG: YdbL family protein [Proteobacteria bacterium]|nr:YdbL family protein [Pseudomonadota bacterium]
MNAWYRTGILFSFMLVTACVTINVYFPAAEMESAAEKIVRDVLKEEQQEEGTNDNPQGAYHRHQESSFLASINPLNFIIGSAHAQPTADITLSSPAIDAITARMKQRVNDYLRGYLNKNVIGFTNDGLVEIVNIDQLDLKERQAVKKVVADENRDRIALYREMAVANDHPEWEDQVRQAFVKQWIAQAQSGWLYQDNSGRWVNK